MHERHTISQRRYTMENERITRTTIHSGQQPTKAQIQEIEKASAIPIIPDEDAPELTMEQYAEMAAIAEKKKVQKQIDFRHK